MSYAELRRLGAEIFERCGLSPEESDACLDELLDAEWRGKHAFGVQLIPHVLGWHRRKRGEPEVIDRGPAAAFIEGHGTVGPRVARMAMDLAMAKAEEAGLAAVGLRNHTPWIVAGYHPRRAAEAGFVAATCSAGVKIAAPHGGFRPVFGTNPLGFAVPAAGGPIVLDMACTLGSASVLRDAETLPEGAAVDARGEPTRDPKAARKGALRLFGASKGSGIALMVELLSGAWLGAKTGGRHKKARGAVFFAARADLFGFEALEEWAEDLVRDVLESGFERQETPRVPGRGAVDFAAPIEIDDSLLQELRKLADGRETT